MLSPETIAIVKSTAPVIKQHGEAITARMYHLMFSGNPEVKQFFNPAHQRPGGQISALAAAICAYAQNIDNLAALGPAVELIAQKHASLHIKPEHYPIVGKHLFAAVKDVLGDAATDEVINAWGEAYGFLAQVFIGREAEIYKEQAEKRGGWSGFRSFVVDRRVEESAVITSFYLKPQDGGSLPAFRPGQYITIKVDTPQLSGARRNYSLSDRPGHDYFRISVKRETGVSGIEGVPMGVVSNYLHDHVQVGDVIDVGPPCGEFFLELESERPLVLLAGGVGVTPLMSMLNTVIAAEQKRPTWFFHAVRNSAVHALGKDLRRLANEHEHVHVHVLYDNPADQDVAGEHYDTQGFISPELLRDTLPSKDCDFYFCGPQPFMRSIYKGLTEWGVPQEQIHYEFFGPAGALAAG